MNKQEREREKEIRAAWNKMSVAQKAEWNGYLGFRNKLRYKEDSIFIPVKVKKENSKEKSEW